MTKRRVWEIKTLSVVTSVVEFDYPVDEQQASDLLVEGRAITDILSDDIGDVTQVMSVGPCQSKD